MRVSKLYIADEIEMAGMEEAGHEVADFYIHSLGFEMLIY